MKLTDYLQLVRKVACKKPFANRKEIVVEMSKINPEITYDKVKHFWQDNPVLATELDKLINTKPILSGNLLSSQVANATTAEEILTQIEEEYNQTFYAQVLASQNSIEFKTPYICITNMADIHLGDKVDIRRLFDESKVICETNGMYVNFAGDLYDNFIGAWANKIAIRRKITPDEEQKLGEFWLNLIEPKLIAMVAGNHDLWSDANSGTDYFKNKIASITKNIFYDTYDLSYSVKISGNAKRIRMRHDWMGRSIYNPTHGIESTCYRSNKLPFDIGVGAHTHASGLYREFNVNGKTGVAILCGTYKPFDDYAQMLGVPHANKSTAVSVIIGEDGTMIGCSDVFAAAKLMRLLLK